jgi:hypothetical protein
MIAVGVCCVIANAVAVAFVEPLSTHHLGPLALAYHHRHPSFMMILPLLLLPLLLSSLLRGVIRTALLVFAGAAIANIASAALWIGAVPDYIVLRRLGVITNLSDLIMVASAMVVIASLLGVWWRRSTTRERPLALPLA